MKVRATRNGYLGHRRRYSGDVFYIDSELFSENWMENLDAPPPVEEFVPTNDKKVSASMTMEQLFDYCKANSLKGYSGLSKTELVEAINKGDLECSDPKLNSEPVEDDVI